MEQNYALLAQSRANYYTKGSPIQFVRVELLKGDVTGEVAVCLTFKNVAPQPVSGLVVRFKCKSSAGTLLCEDEYTYQGFTAAQGELFGADDAVYISDVAIGSVEVDLEEAILSDGSTLQLGGYRRVRLPAPKALPARVSQALGQRLGKQGLTIAPQMLEDGWYCACGAFHPKEEDSVYCSECGCDRILLQNSLSGLLQQGQSQSAAPVDEPTRVIPAARPDEPTRVVPTARPEEPTRVLPAGLSQQEKFAASYHGRNAAPLEEDEDWDAEDDRPAKGRAGQSTSQFDIYGEDGGYDEDGYEDDPDETAEKIIRWAPPITAALCALVVAFGFLWYQFVL